MINVGLMSHSSSATGAEKMLLNLAILLKNEEMIKPILFIPQNGDGSLIELAIKNKLDYEIIPASKWYVYVDFNRDVFKEFCNNNIDNLKLVKEKILENNIDIIINNTLTNIIYLLAAVELNLPVITWVHGILDSYMINANSYFRLLIDRIVLELSDKVVFCSNWTKNYYEGFFLNYKNKEKFITIYNWTYEPSTDYETKSYINENIFVCLNTFDHNKGINTLIEAAEILKKSNYNFKVYLFGDGQEKINLKKFVTQKELNNYILFNDRTNDISNVYNKCLALIQPSYIESFGMTIIEAMAHKKPVISAKSGGPEEIIVDNVCGFLIDVGDKHQLAEKMEYLLNNQDKAKQLGNKGYDIYKKRFSPNGAKDLFINLIKDVYQKFSGYSSEKLVLYDLLNFFIRHNYYSNKNEIKEEHKINKNNAEDEKENINNDIDFSNLIPSRRIRNNKKYKILIYNDEISKISIIIGTHFKRCKGLIKLNIKTKDSNYIIRSTILNLEHIDDNQLVTFNFDTIKYVKGKYFIFEFELFYLSDNKISIYEYKVTSNKILNKLVNKKLFCIIE
ncbi:MAG: glycosyltransferase family 4 protein [Caloramator sp.]|nr:glycosyltransferase family 4 protein [Caloramator sp.]